ncbi:MAG TPA: phenylalanine--tRNA ligase subunit beta [Mycobacteriales bacterium]|nr:phenylalanine--tRNA ligase subunit beta [Mycobacteriales bacterium]
MRVPVSWLADYADLAGAPARGIADALIRVGLEVERVESLGSDIANVVVARVLDIEEVTGVKKPIRYCRVDDGDTVRSVICGATNFAVGDLVALAKPGAGLPGGVRIEAREAYRRTSEGMICSGRELGLSDDHAGILVLAADLELGADVVRVLGLADDILDIAVTPDRGYCLSIRGVAREAAAALGVRYRDPAAQVKMPRLRPGGPAVRVEDFIGCDRYVARGVERIDPSRPTPPWLARRLTVAGMRPISLTVDVTNYVLLDLGQPLHAFDAGRLVGQIVVRRALPGERLATLDGLTRDLDPDDLVIADGSGPIGLAGVMGGGPTEVGPTTTSVVIEAAHFDPASVARTARRHRLSTEASRRFERGVDDALAPVAAQLAVQLLLEHAGATAAADVTDIDGRPGRPTLTLPLALPARITGIRYPADTIRRRLDDVGATLTGEDPLTVVPPSWRPDLTAAVDLVEEIARLEGYDQLPVRLPAAPAGRGLTPDQRRRRVASRALAAAGYIEVHTAPFVGPDAAPALLLPEADPRRPSVTVANPLSEEESMLRASLLPGLLAALLRNLGRGFADLGIFEIAPVFRARPGAGPAPAPVSSRRPSRAELDAIEAALPDQPVQVGVVLGGDRELPGWWGDGRRASWADAVGAARAVAGELGVNLVVRAGAAPPWHPGRCAELVIEGGVIGHAGELHPRVVEAFGLPSRTCAAEFALAPLLAAAVDQVPAPAVSPFPVATLDVALVVDTAVTAADLAVALRDGTGPLLESLRLFDVYTGPQVGHGKKSLAYNLRLRAQDRTLTAEEALALRDGAVRVAAERHGATLRS